MAVFRNVLLMICILIIAACSNEDDTTTQVGPQNGGKAFQTEVVTIILPDEQLPELEYQATINDIPVTLIKSNVGTLLFSIPSTLEPGTYNLVIPALNNLTIAYNVERTILSDTADNVMANFRSKLITFSTILDDSPEAIALQATLNSFNQYYTSAPAAEKELMAIIYQANKSALNELLSPTLAGRGIFGETLEYVRRHTAAVAIMAIGVGLTMGTLPAVGIAVIGIGAYKAYKANTTAHENILNTMKVEIGGWFGENFRNVNSVELVLESGASKNFTFNLGERKLIADDANKTEPVAVDYFNAVEKYNFYANKVNVVIDNTNDDKGTNFSNIQESIVPEESEEVLTAVTPELYSNIDFSITHQNITLVNASVNTEGELTLLVNITGNPTTLPVEADLLYSYSDGLSTFNGKLPFIIKPSVKGTWKLESFENGTALETYFNHAFASGCSTLATASYTIVNETYTIAQTTYNYTGTDRYRIHNITWNGCTILSDGQDTIETDNYSGGGTYTLDNLTFTVTESGQTHTRTFQWLTSNKIKIDDKIYVRM